MRLTIAGAGRTAWAFGSIWSRQEKVTLISRTTPPDVFREGLGVESRPLAAESFEDSELVLFAVSDRAIGPVYQAMSHSIPPRTPVFHASGALTSELFDHHEHGFSLHPLRSLSPVGSPSSDLDGTMLVWEGHASTEECAREITRVARGEFRAIETARKPLYHAAAVFGSNYVAAALETARRLMDEAGIGDADTALERLASSAIGNWARHQGAARFTGPLMRGDTEIVRQHLEILEGYPRYGEAYRILARLLLEEAGPMAEDSDFREIARMVRPNHQS